MELPGRSHYVDFAFVPLLLMEGLVRKGAYGQNMGPANFPLDRAIRTAWS